MSEEGRENAADDRVHALLMQVRRVIAAENRNGVEGATRDEVDHEYAIHARFGVADVDAALKRLARRRARAARDGGGRRDA